MIAILSKFQGALVHIITFFHLFSMVSLAFDVGEQYFAEPAARAKHKWQKQTFSLIHHEEIDLELTDISIIRKAKTS